MAWKVEDAWVRESRLQLREHPEAVRAATAAALRRHNSLCSAEWHAGSQQHAAQADPPRFQGSKALNLTKGPGWPWWSATCRHAPARQAAGLVIFRCLPAGAASMVPPAFEVRQPALDQPRGARGALWNAGRLNRLEQATRTILPPAPPAAAAVLGLKRCSCTRRQPSRLLPERQTCVYTSFVLQAFVAVGMCPLAANYEDGRSRPALMVEHPCMSAHTGRTQDWTAPPAVSSGSTVAGPSSLFMYAGRVHPFTTGKQRRAWLHDKGMVHSHAIDSCVALRRCLRPTISPSICVLPRTSPGCRLLRQDRAWFK